MAPPTTVINMGRRPRGTVPWYESHSDCWFGADQATRELVRPQGSEAETHYLLFLSLHPERPLTKEILAQNWPLYVEQAKGAKLQPVVKSFGNGGYLECTGVKPGRNGAEGFVLFDELAYDGEGCYVRVVNTADRAYSAPLHPQRGCKEAVTAWKFSFDEPGPSEAESTAIITAGLARGDWADLSRSTKEKAQKEWHLRIGFAKEAFQEDEVIKVVAGGKTLTGEPFTYCGFCLKSPGYGKHLPMHCKQLLRVNEMRAKVHPEWAPVEVLADGSVLWEDKERSVALSDFIGLEAKVAALQTEQKALRALIEELKGKQKVKEEKEEGPVASGSKRKGDGEEPAGKKKAKGGKGKAKKAQTPRS
ncbi:hypothetical protein BN946_scf184614.g2 [Trametes cinnabarina]|uniref:Uncharacterized protein n=1 Tax=Pycnoporus cinnabarinus TaxID=5643 RepID=A0A060T0S0_PYCCI|nr:hypothetical protein BN946_scf184614.g2 [Trametes cinnabarina]